MVRKRCLARILCVLLGASVLSTTLGCKRAELRANEHRNLVSVGMTKAQVEDRLGSPDDQFQDRNDRNVEVWFYTYVHGGIGLWTMAVLLAITVVGGVLIFAAAYSDPYDFTVRFNREGVVVEVTPVKSRFQQ